MGRGTVRRSGAFTTTHRVGWWSTVRATHDPELGEQQFGTPAQAAEPDARYSHRDGHVERAADRAARR
jgi:hypothetical protein